MRGFGGTGFERNCHGAKSKAGTILPSITQGTLFDLLDEVERLRAELRFSRNH
jgi:hypothetical protein